MFNHLNLEQSIWMEEKIKQVSYPCTNVAGNGSSEYDAYANHALCTTCKGSGRIFYAGMTNYLERHGGVWPGLVWVNDGLEWWDDDAKAVIVTDTCPRCGQTQCGHASVFPVREYYHALPFISGDGQRGALEILELECGWTISRNGADNTWSAGRRKPAPEPYLWTSVGKRFDYIETPSALLDLIIKTLDID